MPGDRQSYAALIQFQAAALEAGAQTSASTPVSATTGDSVTRRLDAGQNCGTIASAAATVCSSSHAANASFAV